MWELIEGIAVARLIQKTAHDHYFAVSLGGSVLNQGRSEHDLDLVVHRFAQPPVIISPAKFLKNLMTQRPELEHQSDDEKGPHTVIRFTWNGKPLELWFVTQ